MLGRKNPKAGPASATEEKPTRTRRSLQAEIDQLKQLNLQSSIPDREMRQQARKTKIECDRLREENKALRQALDKEREHLREENKMLQRLLDKERERLRAENAALEQSLKKVCAELLEMRIKAKRPSMKIWAPIPVDGNSGSPVADELKLDGLAVMLPNFDDDDDDKAPSSSPSPARP